MSETKTVHPTLSKVLITARRVHDGDVSFMTAWLFLNCFLVFYVCCYIAAVLLWPECTDPTTGCENFSFFTHTISDLGSPRWTPYWWIFSMAQFVTCAGMYLPMKYLYAMLKRNFGPSLRLRFGLQGTVAGFIGGVIIGIWHDGYPDLADFIHDMFAMVACYGICAIIIFWGRPVAQYCTTKASDSSDLPLLAGAPVVTEIRALSPKTPTPAQLAAARVPSLAELRVPSVGGRYPLAQGPALRWAMYLFYFLAFMLTWVSLVTYIKTGSGRASDPSITPFLNFCIWEWLVVSEVFICVFILFSSIPAELASSAGPDPARLAAVSWYFKREAAALAKTVEGAETLA
jgi:hypothetical protein|eukprot:gnl/Ergobibamus_cyprinoides/589.p1 GENE.gnl/Ergobibamus_cyprinoides/589~~gnl/Ergobibamus_cyprinoides/589.p1  ORF type:complete len:345 (+),score=98.21 gnl/Ergobibamus_cyprinoides/589:35-1069(+)